MSRSTNAKCGNESCPDSSEMDQSYIQPVSDFGRLQIELVHSLTSFMRIKSSSNTRGEIPRFSLGLSGRPEMSPSMVKVLPLPVCRVPGQVRGSLLWLCF